MRALRILPALLGTIVAAGALLLGATSASASKEVIASFGGSTGTAADVAVNGDGAGPADPGDVYLARSNRIQRLALDDGGTPSDPYDDTYEFVSDWGADVDSSTAETGYEICTVEAQCKAAIASGAEGAFSNPSGIAVDGDTGQVFVADQGNDRVNVYEGDGTFLRSFGWDVVASGPGDNGVAYEVCIGAVDICKAGLSGAGVGQLANGLAIAVSPPDGNGATGTVFVADDQNRRVATYELSGANPSSFGSAANLDSVREVAVDSRGVVYIARSVGEGQGIARYDSQNANGGGVGFLTPIPAEESVAVGAGSNAYVPRFQGLLASTDVGQITISNGATPLSGGSGLSVVRIQAGNAATGANEKQSLIVNAAAGQFKTQVTTGVLCGTLAIGSQVVTDVDTCPNADFSYGAIRVGDAISTGGADIPDGTTVTAVGAGTITLSQAATGSGLRGLLASETTANVAYNAPASGAGSLQSALAALPGIEPADVSVTGGPGSPGGANPYEISFGGVFSAREIPLIAHVPGTTPLSGGTHSSAFTITPGGSGNNERQALAINATAGQFRLTFEGQTTSDLPFNASASQVAAALRDLSSVPPPTLAPSGSNGTVGIEVDPDSDGPGPDEDVVYVLRTFNPGAGVRSVVHQFGPVNAPGLTAPPATFDDTHGSMIGFTIAEGLGLDALRGRLFVSSSSNIAGSAGSVYVLDQAGGVPTVSLDSISNVTATTATVNATVDPNGGPPVSYHIEYSTDGVEWISTSETLVGIQETPQPVEAILNPVPAGLTPATLYHVRVVATKVFTPSVISGEQTFTSLPAAPTAETVGSPVRTGTSVRFDGRVNPRGQATTYHFEYGTQGPCDSNACQASPELAAGSGSLVELVSQQVEGLQPDTTYHYRLVAENGTGAVAGEDMTVITRSSDAPLSHGHFPGPAGSDRAWEQVNLPDTGGNPVIGGTSFSDDGNRAVYQIGGGTPISDSGSAFSLYFAERTSSGWQTRGIIPKREEVAGPNWLSPAGGADLLNLVAMNANVVDGKYAFWRLRPNASPEKLAEVPARGDLNTSDDGSRVVISSGGVQDVSSGTPQLLSLLPGNEAACDAGTGGERRTEHWLSADGSRLIFMGKGSDCSGIRNLYLRDITAETTTPITTSPVSGAHCESLFLKQAPGAVFFWSVSRFAAQDTVPANCQRNHDGDVYRYDIDAGTLGCVTCVVPGLPADVFVNNGALATFGAYVAVSEDGSKVYFSSPNRLLPGTVAGGAYRVDVSSGELAYVGPLGGGQVGDFVGEGEALNPDGSVLIFRSSAAGLNQLNGSQNGGTEQYYRYDDHNRSLTCVSCPRDGSVPAYPASKNLAVPTFTQEISPNADPLDDSGNVFAFATPNSLVGPDQNTPTSGNPALGTDVYEWRDGRVLLVSDGLTNWPQAEVVPAVNGVSPSGDDVFFTAAAQYTPDALDAYSRLYTARLGGGIEFPPPPKPCPLEVCQGTPKGAPEEAPPGSGSFQGPGNAAPATPRRTRCAKGKVRRRSRCVPKPHKKEKQRKASQGRRAAR